MECLIPHTASADESSVPESIPSPVAVIEDMLSGSIRMKFQRNSAKVGSNGFDSRHELWKLPGVLPIVSHRSMVLQGQKQKSKQKDAVE